MTIKTLIFDLDGTLINSDPDLANALNRVLSDFNLGPLSLEQVQSMIGNGAWKLVERGFRATNSALPDTLDNLTKRFIEYYSDALDVETTLYPGVIETLGLLKSQGHRLMVCTNKPIAPTQKVLKSFGLTSFMDGVVGGDSYAFKKPDGRHITQLLTDKGCAIDNAVMIGDSQNDVYAARDADIPVIFMTFGYSHIPAKELDADVTLDHFEQIPTAIKQL